MYVAVKGGERAIDNAHRLLQTRRRGDPATPAITLTQIAQQLKLSVDRVMAEGALYDPELAALAIKQASGDLVEAIFLLRAYRTTLPRLALCEPVDSSAMLLTRRISATFKDIPGGQLLGATYDYTHRLLDFALLAENEQAEQAPQAEYAETGADAGWEQTNTEANDAHHGATGTCPGILNLLNKEGLIEDPGAHQQVSQTNADLTREPLTYPASRGTRLQALARGDEGYLLALGYSTQRGYGRNHPFAGEIRQGKVALTIVPEELGFAVEIGDIEISECQMINQFVGKADKAPEFTRGYGLVFGNNERKAMSMALVDRALRAEEFAEEQSSPAQKEEFVLSHCDNVEASGFVSHLKLPHYVDFQAELELLRNLRKRFLQQQQQASTASQADSTSTRSNNTARSSQAFSSTSATSVAAEVAPSKAEQGNSLNAPASEENQ